MGTKNQDRSRHLITRGNLDGIVCAAVFLHHHPASRVSFVTSPPAAVRALAADRTSETVYLADIPVNKDMATAVGWAENETVVVDHHPTSESGPGIFIDLDRSAAGALHRHLGASPALAGLAATADLHERADEDVLRDAIERHGRSKLEREASVLDFAWRSRVEDDAFRLDAARSLSAGRWPSEVPSIVERWTSVLGEGRWAKAVGRVGRELQVRGKLGLLDLREKRLSLQGFGSVALVEAARARGCHYALMLHDAKDCSIVSMRSVGGADLDLGRFIEDFTGKHGLEGGGHRSSAGARVPRAAADVLIDRLSEAAC